MKTLVALAALLISFASTADILPFTQEKFDALQAEGKPVLVDVNAKWCSTCKKQGKVINAYLEEKDTDLTVLKVDFDDQKDVVRAFRAPRQSTLILFDDGQEVARAIAKTNKRKLYAMFDKAE